jgi:hypothetical protein
MPAIMSHERSIRESLLIKFSNHKAAIDEDCMLWTGVKTPDGYGYIKQMDSRSTQPRKSKTIFVHRLAYQNAFGDIPESMVVDHICHDPATCQGGITCKHRSCINPEHLKLSTHLENRVRSVMSSSVKGMCRNNLHEWSEDNVKTWKSGKKVCAACHKETTRKAGIRLRNKRAVI